MDDKATKSSTVLAELFQQIETAVNDCDTDTAGRLQLFFESELTLEDIAFVYETTAEDIEQTIILFTAGLLTSVSSLSRLACFQSPASEAELGVRALAKRLIEDCDKADSAGAWFRDVVGTALRVNTPVHHSRLADYIRTLTDLNANCEPSWKPAGARHATKEPCTIYGPRTIMITNQKGGCGKTTIAINLASALAEAGQSVLLVDMDPQSHCAVGLAVPEEQIEQSIYDVLISRSRNEPTKLTEILWQISDRLELAPASTDLSALEQQMAGIADREYLLLKALSEVKDNYDYAVIDCPPAMGLLTLNALRAATDVIVPVEMGYFALHGLSKKLETLSILSKQCNRHVDVRVLASMYDIRTKMAREVLAELRSHFGDKMFKTIVCFNTKIKEASSFGQPISEYDPASKGHKDFCSLAAEILGSQVKQYRHEFASLLADQLESISATAEELLQAAEPLMMPVEAPPADQQRELDLHTGRLIDKEAQTEGCTPEGSQEPRAIRAPEADTPEECIAAKLSDYYGISQINDAVVFVTLYPRAHSVQIAGDFNNWKPEDTPMQKVGNSGVWQTQMKLPAGRYRYRLVVDGQWQQDPYNELTEPNPVGGFNSVLEIK